MHEARFDRIFIIESLGLGDTLTGSELYSEALHLRSLVGKSPLATYHQVHGLSEFFELLERIEHETLEGEFLPMMHLETHGAIDGTGLVFESQEKLPWKDLRARLGQINKASRNNLLVSMAACSSARMFEALLPTEQAPFWGFVGPWNPVNVGDVQNFSRFFEDLFDSGNVNKAIKALNSKVPKERHFYFYNSEEVFDKLWRTYERRMMDPERRFKHIQDIMSLTLSNIEIRQNYSIPDLRKAIDGFLTHNMLKEKERMKQKYLGTHT